MLKRIVGPIRGPANCVQKREIHGFVTHRLTATESLVCGLCGTKNRFLRIRAGSADHCGFRRCQSHTEFTSASIKSPAHRTAMCCCISFKKRRSTSWLVFKHCMSRHQRMRDMSVVMFRAVLGGRDGTAATCSDIFS